MARPAASIVLELDPGADPIAGQVRAPDQDPRAFTGWTGLFAALRAATGAGAGAGPPRDGGMGAPGSEHQEEL